MLRTGGANREASRFEGIGGLVRRASRGGNHGVKAPGAEWLRRLAARGSRAMSTLPAPFPALTEPAVAFDPAAFAGVLRRKRL
jgi:hypothetical protein